jgi:hypothetical protein
LSRTAQAVESPPRGPSKWEASTLLSIPELRHSSPTTRTLLQTKIAISKRLCDRLWLTARKSLTNASGGDGTDLKTNPFLSVAL